MVSSKIIKSSGFLKPGVGGVDMILEWWWLPPSWCGTVTHLDGEVPRCVPLMWHTAPAPEEQHCSFMSGGVVFAGMCKFRVARPQELKTKCMVRHGAGTLKT